MNVHADLVNEPQALRAILMASATHNIQGSTYIPTHSSLDFADGAGGIVGVHARDIARLRGSWPNCTFSCWHSVHDNNNIQSGSLWRDEIYVKYGARMRVVISWWGSAEPNQDALKSDYDLVVRDPTGAIVATANSSDNNYEMVDFHAIREGLYTMEIQKYSSTETENDIGLAALVWNPTRTIYWEATNSLYIPVIAK